MNETTPLKLAVVGAGPVGLALALHAANALPEAEITLFDARPADKDVAGDPRTLALSLGSVQLLERLGAWRAESAQPIGEVHVSQQAPSLAAAANTPPSATTARSKRSAMPASTSTPAGTATFFSATTLAPKRLKRRFGSRATAACHTACSGATIAP